jgi:hypothetical protein
MLISIRTTIISDYFNKNNRQFVIISTRTTESSPNLRLFQQELSNQALVPTGADSATRGGGGSMPLGLGRQATTCRWGLGRRRAVEAPTPIAERGRGEDARGRGRPGRRKETAEVRRVRMPASRRLACRLQGAAGCRLRSRGFPLQHQQMRHRL